MAEIIKEIFFSDPGSPLNNAALLVYRILLAIELFRVHGMKKFKGKKGQGENIPNPLKLPAGLNNFVAIFAEIIAPFLIIAGIGTRLVVLPVIGITAIGYFIVHRKDNIEVRDIPYMYTLSFLLLLILGAGTYSIDAYVFDFLNR